MEEKEPSYDRLAKLIFEVCFVSAIILIFAGVVLALLSDVVTATSFPILLMYCGGTLFIAGVCISVKVSGDGWDKEQAKKHSK